MKARSFRYVKIWEKKLYKTCTVWYVYFTTDNQVLIFGLQILIAHRKRSSANISTDSSRTENIGRNIGGIFSLQFLSSMLWFTISYLPKQFSQATISDLGFNFRLRILSVATRPIRIEYFSALISHILCFREYKILMNALFNFLLYGYCTAFRFIPLWFSFFLYFM
jgi:hypothetical protein